MRQIRKPNFKVDEIFNGCYTSLKEGERKERVKLYKSQLIVDECKYHELFCNNRIDQFVDGLIGDHMTQTELEKNEIISDMKYLYKNKLADKNAVCRKYYKRLANPDETILTCPFCEIDSIQTLDHYLPKSLYPSLAITPVNLVGMCSKCNTKKSDRKIESADKFFLHPYYSDVIKNNPYELKYHKEYDYIEFKVNPLIDDEGNQKQIMYHIEKLELIERMNEKKMAFLTEIKDRLRPLKEMSDGKIDIYDKYLKHYPSNSFIQMAIVQELRDNNEFLEAIVLSLD